MSVELDVQHGPVTLLGLGQDADGGLSFVTSEGAVVPGPLPEIGNTTSRLAPHSVPAHLDQIAVSGGLQDVARGTRAEGLEEEPSFSQGHRLPSPRHRHPRRPRRPASPHP